MTDLEYRVHKLERLLRKRSKFNEKLSESDLESKLDSIYDNLMGCAKELDSLYNTEDYMGECKGISDRVELAAKMVARVLNNI